MALHVLSGKVEGEGTPDEIPNLIEDETDSDDDDAMGDPCLIETSFFSPASTNQAVANCNDPEPGTCYKDLPMPDCCSISDSTCA